MKRYIKLYALLAMALFVGSCEDELDFGRDNNKSTTPATIVSGGEIVFGASAAKKSTRTIYGNPFDTNEDEKNDKIELKWVVDDKVQIASPESAGVANGVAEYKVTGVTNSTIGNRPSTATLERTGAAGLQWNDVGEGAEYNFYAVYPSVEQLSKSIPASVAKTCGLTADGKLTGYLPNTQTVTRIDKTVRDYVFEPNMDYAYMVAKEAYKIPKLDADGNPEDKDADGNPIDASIDLNFSSVVTALKFTIKPGEIGLTNENEDEKISTIRVTDLTLYSEKGAELCGAFKCDFSNAKPTFETNNAYSGFSQVAMKLGEDGCTLSSKSGSITTTFFLLPIEGGYTKGDLMLRIHYYVGDVPQYMTARLGVDIPVSQMTYINNLTMKPLNTSVEGSAWFSALNSNIYLSQVSIPVASNVFASSIYFTGDAYNNLHQQVKKYTDLWDMGVRGFEFVNRRAVTQKYNIIGRPDGYNVNNTHTLANANFVVDENPLEGTGDNFIGDVETFGTAFETLADKLAQNENETLVLVCTYQAVGDGYDPNGYVQQLLNYLDYFVKNNTLGFKQTDFIQINSGTTVGNLKGNIAIIIRPGDDDRYESNSTTASITLNSSTTDWSSNVTLIQDWGTAFDVWDRRYEGVARESTFETLYVIEKAKKRTEPRTMVEDWLCGISSSSTTYTQVSGANNFNDGEEWPAKKEQFNYSHTIKGSAGTAYVQEWARVAGANIGPTYTEARTGYKTSWTQTFIPNDYLWAKWPESITDKKEAIDGLFKMSVAEKGKAGKNLYINSLSGYYIDESVLNNSQKVSLLPFRSSFYGDNNNATNAANQGKGGDHVGLAYDLNQYVYGILSGTVEMESEGYLTEGPWGLVMMEHIGNTAGGADDKSVALVNLIMMNNFRFPLAQKTDVQGASVQRVPLSDEPVDINKNIMVTWE